MATSSQRMGGKGGYSKVQNSMPRSVTTQPAGDVPMLGDSDKFLQVSVLFTWYHAHAHFYSNAAHTYTRGRGSPCTYARSIPTRHMCTLAGCRVHTHTHSNVTHTCTYVHIGMCMACDCLLGWVGGQRVSSLCALPFVLFCGCTVCLRVAVPRCQRRLCAATVTVTSQCYVLLRTQLQRLLLLLLLLWLTFFTHTRTLVHSAQARGPRPSGAAGSERLKFHVLLLMCLSLLLKSSMGPHGC